MVRAKSRIDPRADRGHRKDAAEDPSELRQADIAFAFLGGDGDYHAPLSAIAQRRNQFGSKQRRGN